jgi:CheY-like chemotaxis protein
LWPKESRRRDSRKHGKANAARAAVGWLDFSKAGLRLAPMRSGSRTGTICRVRPTVLIVDDHAEFRRSAGALLEAEGFAVIAEAADGDAAIAVVERLRPQIVLLDVQLPDLDGFTVAERLAAGRDPPVVVLISSREAAAYGPRLQAARARGFIPKRELSGSALAALVG